MARSRVIKPGFFYNEFLAELKFESRLLFAGLWTLADREGRLEDRPRRIKIDVFPWDDVDVDALLDELAKARFVLRYAVAGVRYIQIVNFAKHQQPHYREMASSFPPPDGHTDSGLGSAAGHAVKRQVLLRDGHRCLKCGATERLQVDHILPGSLGGKGTIDNLQTLCAACNIAKGNRHQTDHRPTMSQSSADVEPSLADVGASCAPVSVSVSVSDPVPVAVEEPSAFDMFWDAYPRKVGKPKAESAFRKVNPSGPVLEAMLVAIVTQKRSAQWTRDGGEFIPHPATWLNQRRWEDEIPKAAQTLSYQPEAHEAYDRWPEECRLLHDGECGNYQTHQIRLMRDARPS